MKSRIILTFCALLLFAACEKQPDQFPIVPQIYYKYTTPRTIRILDTASLIKIGFEFTDGDGDIGRDENEVQLAIFVYNKLDTTKERDTLPFPFPFIAKSMRPTKGGLNGDVILNMPGQFFSLDSLHVALGGDTVIYNIFVKDDAGNRSNIITSDTIFVKL